MAKHPPNHSEAIRPQEKQRLNDHRDAERHKLYDQGLGDRAIARIVGVDKSAIKDWRRRRGLAPNGKLTPGCNAPIDPEKDAARRALYDRGLNDREIAAIEGGRQNSVLKWRKARNLPSNIPPSRNTKADPSLAFVTPEMKGRCLSLIRRGVSAKLIAAELNVCLKSLERWRAQIRHAQPLLPHARPIRRTARRGANNRIYSCMSPHRRTEAFKLYADGLSDNEIACRLGCSTSAVWQWRSALYLTPVQRRRRQPVRSNAPTAITPFSNDVYARIANVVGRHIAADLRDDAISDLFVAVQEGSISIDEVAQHAPYVVSRVVTDYANRWGDRSLDEEIGDGDGFRMIDRLRDESSSGWLEKMGATVW